MASVQDFKTELTAEALFTLFFACNVMYIVIFQPPAAIQDTNTGEHMHKLSSSVPFFYCLVMLKSE